MPCLSNVGLGLLNGPTSDILHSHGVVKRQGLLKTVAEASHVIACHARSDGLSISVAKLTDLLRSKS